RRRSTDVITSALEIVIALLLGLPLGPAAFASVKQGGPQRRNTAGVPHFKYDRLIPEQRALVYRAGACTNEPRDISIGRARPDEVYVEVYVVSTAFRAVAIFSCNLIKLADSLSASFYCSTCCNGLNICNMR
ncbi:hypothetical protein QCM80_46230, partial [Bradyrhizobium sp. SSUT112]|uniref:hypothetical protein n=1 Tax=Bradyrhizobium sp. SSUT112 TaxID=3040604 RepID=UPI00244A2BD9